MPSWRSTLLVKHRDKLTVAGEGMESPKVEDFVVREVRGTVQTCCTQPLCSKREINSDTRINVK
jgi:hypothetical protein